MVGEYLHLRRFHSDEVMVGLFDRRMRIQNSFEIQIYNGQELLRLVKKNILVFEVVTGEIEVVSAKQTLFGGHNLNLTSYDLGHDHKLSYSCPRS